MPLTELGFKRRTYDEILTDKIATAKALFGEDIEISELTPLGKYLRINAYDQAITEEEAELIYYSRFPNTATGTSLDRVCKFAGIVRNAATYAQYVVDFKGTAGAVIPSGFLVGTDAEVSFIVVAQVTDITEDDMTIVEGDVTIGEDGTAQAVVEAYDSGDVGNVTPSEITVIVNPAADVESVIGTKLLVKGQDTESDYELRSRFNQAREGLGACNESSLISALLRITSVTHAGIITNETDSTDAAGRPPRSFECFVTGGENYHKEIAEAIFEKKPIGIKTYGAISQEVTDSGGHTHNIYFSHSSNVDVYIRVAIKVSAEFEGQTGKEEIKSNIETYIDNVGIGNTLVRTALYGQIHSVKGVQEVEELFLSTDGSSWGIDNISVERFENCRCIQLELKTNNDADYGVI